MKRAAASAIVAVTLTGCGPALVPVPGPSSKTAKPIAVARPCAHQELEPSLALLGATGKLVGGVTFRVRARGPCSVFPVPPRVTLIGASQRTQIYAVAHAFTDPTQPSLRAVERLRRGDRLAMRLEWSNWCGARPRALVIRILHSGSFRLHPADTPPCLSSGKPTRLGVGPVVPIR